jgi:hypothetical protein
MPRKRPQVDRKKVLKQVNAMPSLIKDDDTTQQLIYRLRAMEMLKMRMMNNSYAEIARHFDTTPTAVQQSLDWAVRQGAVVEHENRIISELAGPAIEVYKRKLSGEDGDPYVAKDVLDKIIKLGDRFEQREQSQQEIGLRSYLEQKRTERDQQPKEVLKNVGYGSTTAATITIQPLTPANPPVNQLLLDGDSPAANSFTEGGTSPLVPMSHEDYISTQFQSALQQEGSPAAEPVRDDAN